MEIYRGQPPVFPSSFLVCDKCVLSIVDVVVAVVAITGPLITSIVRRGPQEYSATQRSRHHVSSF